MSEPNNRYIQVSQEDIDGGLPAVASACAIAKALYRQLPTVNDVLVDWMVTDERIECWVHNWRELPHTKWYVATRRFDVDEDMRAFILAYDEGNAVQPFEFRLVEREPQSA